jgi:hypothetical protein
MIFFEKNVYKQIFTLKSTIRSCPVGLAQIKLTTKQAILKVWQEEWNKHDKCGQTKVFFNTINTKKMAPLLGKCNRQTIGTIIQFITGHCFLLRHQNQKINPQAGLPVICRLCKDPNTLETPEHLKSGRARSSLTEEERSSNWLV